MKCAGGQEQARNGRFWALNVMAGRNLRRSRKEPFRGGGAGPGALMMLYWNVWWGGLWSSQRQRGRLRFVVKHSTRHRGISIAIVDEASSRGILKSDQFGDRSRDIKDWEDDHHGDDDDGAQCANTNALAAEKARDSRFFVSFCGVAWFKGGISNGFSIKSVKLIITKQKLSSTSL